MEKKLCTLLSGEGQNFDITNEVIKSFSDEFQIIYRINVITGEYEIVLMNMENPEFSLDYKDFFELEENYMKYGVEKEYVSLLPGENGGLPDYPNTIKLNTIREYFSIHNTPLNSYYKEKSGAWLKLTVTPEAGYSDEHPYVIYAIKECSEQINEKTRNIIYDSAVSKMYCLVVTVDRENETYQCIHCEEGLKMREGTGPLKEFTDMMKRQIYEEDYASFESLITGISPDTVGFTEREYRIEDEDGMFHFLNAFATYITVPEGGRILLLVRNVDERAANRARMESLNEEYNRAKNVLYALGNSYFGIYYLNLEKKHIITFRQGEDVKNIFKNTIDYEQIIENYIRIMVYPEDKSLVRSFSSIENISSVLHEEGQRMYCEYQRTFGSVYRWIRLEFQAVKCIDGKPIMVIMAFKDIHNEREAELRYKQELREALIAAKQASEAKSRFLSNMSHDIRTPMNAIMGMTSIALGHINNSNKVRDCLEKINISANHLLRLINEVLDMSYIESGKIILKSEEFNLIELIETVVYIMQEQFDAMNQTFSMDVSAISKCKVMGDRVRIQQILLNVLGNASKYTPKCGKITMTVEQTEDLKDMGTYVFTVADTGKGMSEEFIQKIFNPFEREEKIEEEIEGSGLGMAISKSIVDLMNGDITVESSMNKGSVVTVILPLQYVKEESDVIENVIDDKEENPYGILRGKKVLVVDDNEINCDIACDYLEDIGIITDVAINGKEAYNIISTGEYFDAVLMDIRMPIMNGYEATRKIRGIGTEYAENIPIIAMTANAFEEDVQMSLRMGMNAHISKPLSADMMYSALAKVFVAQ